jgi:hypothetical protein
VKNASDIYSDLKMKVHKLQRLGSENLWDFIHCRTESQTCLYFPGKRILGSGFGKSRPCQPDFYPDKPGSIELAEMSLALRE